MAPFTSLLSHDNSSRLHLASAAGIGNVFGFCVAVYLFYCFVAFIYQIYFSPLRDIPGPKSWIAFPVLRHISAIKGTLDIDCRRFFDYYKSDAIRVSDDEVFFNSAPAWQEIYGHGHTPQLIKKYRRPASEPHNVLNALSDADHTRFRKALSHAFSDKALREQEPLLQGYVDMLIKRLKARADTGDITNMTEYYNYITFDIIGDLSLGQPFGCLEQDGHWWPQHVLKMIPALVMIRAAFSYPILTTVLKYTQTKAKRNARAEIWKFAYERVSARRNNESANDRKDFIDFMEKHKGDMDEIDDDEMVSNMFILIIAGSETTASLLTGLTYYLLKTPHAYKKLTEEIRTTFSSEDDITINSINTLLPYTIACLTEGLRIYPPAPSVFPRYTYQEEIICGRVIPKDTGVAVHQSGAYHSESNFKHAKSFIPERWLPENYEKGGTEFYEDQRKVLEPFHVGPRNCIGRNLALAEMRLILVRVLYNFDFELCDGMDGWAEKQKSYLIWYKGPMNVRLRRVVKAEK